MSIDPTMFPAISGISWRAARREDVPALEQLQLATNRVYGKLDAHAAGSYVELFEAGTEATTAALCGVDESGAIVAFGSVAVHTLAHEHRAYLDGLVHPELGHRGLGTFLLEWGEAQGRELLRNLPPDRPAMLLIDFMDRRDDAVPLYESHGFAFKLAEDTMRRDLSEAITDVPRPHSITLTPWDQVDPHLFYVTYHDAFRHRPGFPGWSEDVWREAFTGSDAFRPDLSLLATSGDVPLGYILCEVNQAREGWIPQMGVRPTWRGRGVGATLLDAVLRALRSEGLHEALLDVNINNPQARRLYERLGFRPVARRTVYVKQASARRE